MKKLLSQTYYISRSAYMKPMNKSEVSCLYMKLAHNYYYYDVTFQNTEEASTSTTVLKAKTDKKPLRSSGMLTYLMMRAVL